MLRCHAEVSQILDTASRAVGVQLTSGETIAAEIVVSNANSAWTYRHLLSPEVRRRWTDRKIENLRYSNGLFVWYFGTDRRYEDVGPTTITLGPRYKEFLKDIFNRKSWRRISTCICTGRPRPIPRSRPWLRRLVRAVAGAAPRRQHRLGNAGRAVSAGDREVPRPDLDPLASKSMSWPRSCRHAARLPGPAAVVQGRRVSAWSRCCCRAPSFRPHNKSEDVEEPVSCRCRHASRRRGAWGAVLRQGSRYGGAGSACLRASGRRPRLTSSPAAH